MTVGNEVWLFDLFDGYPSGLGYWTSGIAGYKIDDDILAALHGCLQAAEHGFSVATSKVVLVDDSLDLSGRQWFFCGELSNHGLEGH